MSAGVFRLKGMIIQIAINMPDTTDPCALGSGYVVFKLLLNSVFGAVYAIFCSVI